LTWQPTSLAAPKSPYSWQRWQASWNATPGIHVLKARATDSRGRTQPEAADWNLLGYANNGIQSVSVTIRH